MSEQYSVNSKLKDRLFVRIFSDPEHKERVIQLVNALTGSHYQETDEFTFTTLEDVIFIKMKNDVSVLLDEHMYLIEHQSTVCPNLPLRGLHYFSQLYTSYYQQNGMRIYSSKLNKIPTPQFFVMYNGTDRQAEKIEYRLSDAFMTENESVKNKFEWTATVYNINYGQNVTLLEECPSLREYAEFVSIIRENLQKPGTTKEQAIETALEIVIAKGYLDGQFAKWKGDIMYGLPTEFDEEDYRRFITKEAMEIGREEGLQQGMKEGLEQGRAQAEAEFLALLAEKDALIAQLQAAQK